MYIYYVIAIIFIVEFICFTYLNLVTRKKVENQLIVLILQKDLEGFDELLDTWKAKSLVPIFNKKFMRINLLISLELHDEIEKEFDYLDKCKKNKIQEKELLSLQFNYYLQLSNALKTKEALDKLDGIMNETEQFQYHMIYDVFLKKSYNYIDLIEENIHSMNDNDKQINLNLLAVQYRNKGLIEKAKEIEKLIQTGI